MFFMPVDAWSLPWRSMALTDHVRLAKSYFLQDRDVRRLGSDMLERTPNTIYARREQASTKNSGISLVNDHVVSVSRQTQQNL